MKKWQLTIAAAALAAGSAFAADTPPYGPKGNPNQTQNQGRKAGPSNGKKAGPQDGSGPIHQPGTGGGTGTGQRRGRR